MDDSQSNELTEAERAEREQVFGEARIWGEPPDLSLRTDEVENDDAPRTVRFDSATDFDWTTSDSSRGQSERPNSD